MKRITETSKLLIKQFIKEKAGDAILEFLVLLAVFGVSVAAISPVVKDKLAEMYDNQSRDITFGGEKGDITITTTPQTNALPAIDNNGLVDKVKKYVFTFDGSTYVKLPSTLNSFGKGASDFTFEGWIYSNSSAKTFYFAKNTSPENGGHNNLLIGESSSGNYAVDVGNTTSGTSVTYISTVPVVKNQKVHLVWSVQSGVMKFYKNGTLVWTQTIQSRNTWDDSYSPQLGMDVDGGSSYGDWYRGVIYEARMYNRALSQTEVTRNKDGNTARSGLLAEYLFNDGPGNIIMDHSGNGNDATIIGTPVWQVL